MLPAIFCLFGLRRISACSVAPAGGVNVALVAMPLTITRRPLSTVAATLGATTAVPVAFVR